MSFLFRFSVSFGTQRLFKQFQVGFHIEKLVLHEFFELHIKCGFESCHTLLSAPQDFFSFRGRQSGLFQFDIMSQNICGCFLIIVNIAAGSSNLFRVICQIFQDIPRQIYQV